MGSNSTRSLYLTVGDTGSVWVFLHFEQRWCGQADRAVQYNGSSVGFTAPFMLSCMSRCPLRFKPRISKGLWDCQSFQGMRPCRKIVIWVGELFLARTMRKLSVAETLVDPWLLSRSGVAATVAHTSNFVRTILAVSDDTGRQRGSNTRLGAVSPQFD
jgi:hypothetical protein